MLGCRVPKTLTGLALAVLVVLALACAPAAPAGQDAAPTPAPPPSPTVDPTAEAAIESLLADPTVRAAMPTRPPDTPTPVPTGPTPTRDPDDPAKPTSTPLPTRDPLPATPEPAVAPSSPHPDGLEGCRNFSIFTATTREEGLYMDWCSEELIRHVQLVCNNLSSSQDQHDCANRELSDVKNYFFRAGIIQCFAITDDEQRLQCSNESTDDLDKHFWGLWNGWDKIRLTANKDATVKVAFKDVITCLEDLGYEKIKIDLLFHWQKFENPEDYMKRDAAYTAEEKDYRIELATPSDKCAKEHGLYEAQDSAWTVELERLADEDPQTAQAMLDAGILDILKKPGAAPFLQLHVKTE